MGVGAGSALGAAALPPELADDLLGTAGPAHQACDQIAHPELPEDFNADAQALTSSKLLCKRAAQYTTAVQMQPPPLAQS